MKKHPICHAHMVYNGLFVLFLFQFIKRLFKLSLGDSIQIPEPCVKKRPHPWISGSIIHKNGSYSHIFSPWYKRIGKGLHALLGFWAEYFISLLNLYSIVFYLPNSLRGKS